MRGSLFKNIDFLSSSFIIIGAAIISTASFIAMSQSIRESRHLKRFLIDVPIIVGIFSFFTGNYFTLLRFINRENFEKAKMAIEKNQHRIEFFEVLSVKQINYWNIFQKNVGVWGVIQIQVGTISFLIGTCFSLVAWEAGSLPERLGSGLPILIGAVCILIGNLTMVYFTERTLKHNNNKKKKKGMARWGSLLGVMASTCLVIASTFRMLPKAINRTWFEK